MRIMACTVCTGKPLSTWAWAPSTATETSDGVYHITYAAQTPGDDLELTVTKNGYDGYALSQIAFS